MAGEESARDDLKTRQLPEMVLSDGSENSMTPPPVPFPKSVDAATRAAKRFAIEGNAIVTGGAGGLGLEAARTLLEHECSGVALFDVNPAQSQGAIDALAADFPQAKIITKQVDVTIASVVNQAVQETCQELGKIKVLLCFAGIVGCVPAVEISPESFRRTIDINTTGSFLCAQAVAKYTLHFQQGKIHWLTSGPPPRHMIAEKHGGSMVFIASISGHSVNYPQPQVAYNVSKSGVLHLVRSLAAEWARYGIRVNSISPGYMDTILNEGDGIVKARQIWASRNPMGRMGQPLELMGPVVMLSSAAGSYITGADLLVDGGGSVF